MFRHCSALLVGLCLVGPSQAAPWADAMFEELSKDFGSVPRGPMLTHPFRVTNNTSSPVRIDSIRVSCGCVTATAQSGYLTPGQSTLILTTMDTRRFSGIKNVTIYVHLSQPSSEEVRLWVQANSRDDVTVAPDTISFGQIKRGAMPTGSVTVTFLGAGQWQITGAQCDSNYVHANVQELRRGMGDVAYLVTAQLRADAPIGKWFTDIWLKTTNPATPRVRVPLTVEIESALTINPQVVDLGNVKVGNRAERRVIVRGDNELKIRDTTPDTKPLHVLAVTLQAATPGELSRPLRIFTDLQEENQIDFHARANIVK